MNIFEDLIEELKEESAVTSAFVVFEEDGDRAELFLPNEDESTILKRESKGKPYKDSHWVLEQQKKYSLKKDGQLLYAGAEVQEGQITGYDSEEQ